MKIRAALGLAVLLSGAAVAAAGPLPHSFQGLGALAPGYSSEARACSADGTVVVGSSGTPLGQRAFVWTRATGTMAALDPPSGQLWSWANDVSADGNYVVGSAGSNFGLAVGWEGIRWGPGGTLDRIAVPGDGVWAKGVSGDGSVVAGSTISEAFTWTPGGPIVGLGGLTPSFRSNADSISADGRVVVGDSVDPADGGTRDAFRWTQETGMVGLGAFTAVACSDDGSVVVGSVNVGPLTQAYRWTAATGIVPLGTYEPNCRTYSHGVSRDGSRVVGYIRSDIDDSSRAFIWDSTNGMRILKDVLVDCGLDLTGWTLTEAWDVSNDGPTIVGRGYNPQGIGEAWVATLPEPATLALVGLGLAALLVRRRR